MLCVGSAALTLPALWVFSTVVSPPAAAVNVVRAIAEGRRGGLARGPGPPVAAQDGAPRNGVPARHDFVLASHYTLQRYLGALPESLELLATGPNDAVARLSQYWLEGGEKDALFLADPRRTDLASIDPRAMRSIGRWTWPLHVDRFMPGARPARAELVRFAPTAWVAGVAYPSPQVNSSSGFL